MADAALLRDVVVYLLRKYPHVAELSKARLTKMVYLADWRSAIIRSRQITDIQWRFNHYGPYVSDVAELAATDPTFEVLAEQNMFGSPKERITLADDEATDVNLTPEDREILDFVIESTKTLYWNDFIALVYSTYPIRSQNRYATLDLVALAGEYRRVEGAVGEPSPAAG